MRLVHPLVAGAVAATAAVSLVGCGSTSITNTALDHAVGPTFARLYQLQQQELGPNGDPARPDGIALCARGANTSNSGSTDPNAGAAAAPGVAAVGPQAGAGDDWSCTVNYPFPDGHIQPIAYDVTVQATGCYTAEGPATVVGQQRIHSASGRTVTNPLFAFDGCLDIG